MTWVILESSIVILQALESMQSQWPQQPEWPQWPRQPHFTEFYVSVNPGTKMTYPGLTMWIGSSKIPYFNDFGSLSLGGCRGHPMRPKWNLNNRGQISKPNEHTDNFKSNLSCKFLSVRAKFKKQTFCPRTPCNLKKALTPLRCTL